MHVIEKINSIKNELSIKYNISAYEVERLTDDYIHESLIDLDKPLGEQLDWFYENLRIAFTEIFEDQAEINKDREDNLITGG